MPGLMGLIRKLGNKPETILASVRRKRGNRVCLLLPDPLNELGPQLAVHLQRIARTTGLRVYVAFGVDQEESQHILNCAMRGEIDAIVNFGGVLPRVFQKAQKAGIPVITDAIQPGWADHVIVDPQQIGRLACSHLLNLGHRRVMALRRSQYEGNSLSEGCREAFKEAGVSENRLQIQIAGPSMEEIEQAITEVIKSRRLPDAMVAWSDHCAEICMTLMIRNGIRIPSGMGLVGVGDVPTAPYMPVPLTTVRIPVGRLASRIVECLKRRMGTSTAAPLVEALEPELVVRESCGAALKKKQSEIETSWNFPEPPESNQ